VAITRSFLYLRAPEPDSNSAGAGIGTGSNGQPPAISGYRAEPRPGAASVDPSGYVPESIPGVAPASAPFPPTTPPLPLSDVIRPVPESSAGTAPEASRPDLPPTAPIAAGSPVAPRALPETSAVRTPPAAPSVAEVSPRQALSLPTPAPVGAQRTTPQELAGSLAAADDPATSVHRTPLQPKSDDRYTQYLDTLWQQELSGNVRPALRGYGALVEQFDALRERVASEIMKLGEIEHQKGRANEASAQFGRILREFVDFPELTATARQYLAAASPRDDIFPSLMGVGAISTPPTEIIAGPGAGSNTPIELGSGSVSIGVAPGATEAVPQNAETLRLLQDEVQLLEKEIAITEQEFAAGTVPESSVFSLKRELLHLRQRIASGGRGAGAAEVQPGAAQRN
jgi:hypothetical protein